jgi:glucose dehydrogenase
MQHCTATLCDMSGKVVKLFADANGIMTRMDVQDVPAGNYILSVNGNITAREKIVIAR